MSFEYFKYGAPLVQCFTASSNAMNAILKSRKSLKSLTFYGYEVFNDDFSSGIEVGLKEINIYPCTFLQSLEELRQRNVNLFLKTQRETLECLRICRIGVEIASTILSMQCLKHITIGRTTISRSEMQAEFFQPNHSVTSLLVAQYDCEVYSLKFLLTVFPNIESLEIIRLNNELASLIYEMCEDIQCLTVEYFDVEKISKEEFSMKFPKLKSFKVARVFGRECAT